MGFRFANPIFALTISLSALLTSAAAAQTSGAYGKNDAESLDLSRQMTVGRNSQLVTAAVAEVADPIQKSVVEIFEPKQHLCLGTVVSKDGLIVTKASELVDEQLQCRFHDGQFAKLSLIARSTQDDLALLSVDPESLVDDVGRTIEFGPIEFHADLLQTETMRPGSLVVTVGSRDNQPMMGIIIIEGQSFSIKNPECTDCIDFGIQGVPITVRRSYPNSRRNGMLTPDTVTTALQVQRVYPRTLAEKSSVLIGDVIEQINGKPVSSQLELIQISKSLRPGDQVSFSIIRNNKVASLSTSISRHSNRIFQDRWGGGPFNRRRFGFTNVLTHDIPIQPDQCGGPLVDLHARTVGINVARSLRVATLAIPIEQVHKFVLSVRPEAEIVVK